MVSFLNIKKLYFNYIQKIALVVIVVNAANSHRPLLDFQVSYLELAV